MATTVRMLCADYNPPPENFNGKGDEVILWRGRQAFAVSAETVFGSSLEIACWLYCQNIRLKVVGHLRVALYFEFIVKKYTFCHIFWLSDMLYLVYLMYYSI